MNLFATKIPITDKIYIPIPTVKEIFAYGEESYHSLVGQLCTCSHDMALFLWDELQIKFTEISDYKLFTDIILPFMKQTNVDVSLVLGGIDLQKLTLKEDVSGEMVWNDAENDITINSFVYQKLVDGMLKLHGRTKDDRNYGDVFHMEIQSLRSKKRADEIRNKNQRHDANYFEKLIIYAVNQDGFKYDFESTQNLTIHQFYQCLQQLSHSFELDHVMSGIYAGTVDSKSFDKSRLSIVI